MCQPPVVVPITIRIPCDGPTQMLLLQSLANLSLALHDLKFWAHDIGITGFTHFYCILVRQ